MGESRHENRTLPSRTVAQRPFIAEQLVGGRDRQRQRHARSNKPPNGNRVRVEDAGQTAPPWVRPPQAMDGLNPPGPEAVKERPEPPLATPIVTPIMLSSSAAWLRSPR